ncbi:MAG TPA: hypothetical protein VL651_06560 [Bacteroidia bacterium]|nr:hypothetical protein [Bacteroidia bacterium]
MRRAEKTIFENKIPGSVQRFFFRLFTAFAFFSALNLPAQTDTAQEQTMTSNFSLNLPMNRDGSGTSWQPDQSPMLMYMKMYSKTSIMFHGAVFLRYTSQDATHQSDRGAEKFDAPNWMMFMLAHKMSEKDLFSFQSMFSLDRLTEGGSGYPLLFQSGETYNGIPIVDRQHPHDLFAELAVNYTHSFSKDLDVNTYFGYPGEPALGPVVFMHRLSAMNDPDASLGHHWQDATHITFGVATIGLRYKMIKAEGSIFTGREPDENRFNFDKPLFDSYSYRISLNPDRFFSIQFSQGFIHSPEALEPAINVKRTTASVIHTKLLKHGKFISSSLIWGMNHNSDGRNLNSVLVESNLKLAPLSVYVRYEFIQKDANELQLLQFTNDPVFNVSAFTLGVNRILFTHYKTDLSLGVQGTVHYPDPLLKPVYGSRPLAAEIYLKLAPTSGHHHH